MILLLSGDEIDVPKVYLSADEIDVPKVYIYTFYPDYIYTVVFGDLLRMLRYYVWNLFRDRYGVNIYTEERWSDGQLYLDIRIDSNNNKFAKVRVSTYGRIEYIYGSIDRKMLRDIIETLGSLAYGAALALLETFSHNPRCVDSCSRYVNELFNRLLRIVYFPVPNLDVYNFVRDLVNRGGVPFRSTVDIDENIYREIREKKNLIEQNRLYRFFVNKYEIDQNIFARFVDDLNGISIVFELPSKSDDVRIYFNISTNKPKLYVYILTDASRDIDQAIDIIGNWYTCTVKAIKKAIEELENLGVVDRGVISVLKDYLESWLKLISMYRDEIEKKKIFS